MSRDALIVQFQTSGGVDDFDRLMAIEESLIQAFAQNGRAEVDGHDFGGGTMNIFIYPTRSWSAAIEIVQTYLKHRGVLDRAVIAKRRAAGSVAVVWPPGFKGSFQI